MKNRWIFLLAWIIPLPLFAQNDTIIRHYNDTVYKNVTETVRTVRQKQDSVIKQRDVVFVADSADRRGHYIQAHIGLGYGSLGYGLQGDENRVNGSFSALLQLQYAYYFTPNWGIGAGLWFTNYTSHARIGGSYIWNGQTDTDYETGYDHTATVNKWNERETIHNLGIPISAQFQMRKDHWKAGIFAAVGIAPSFSVSKKYKVQEGEIAHSGYYPAWDLTLTDMHEFGTKTYTDAPEAKGKLSVRPQVAFFADLGTLIPVTKQIDLMVGAYVNVSMNDANSSNKQEIGWRDDSFDFMNAYQGAYATTLASASHPWEVGVKVGLHWHYIAPPRHETEDYFEYFQRPDTVVRYVDRIDTLIVARTQTITQPKQEPVAQPQEEPVIQAEEETVVPAHIQKVAEEVEQFNKIYFAFDKYELTNKAKFYLNSIVEALNRVPDAKILIDGHASSEGEDAYNDILSENRARTVANYLVRRGVDRSRIVTAGHGSRVPNEDTEREEMRRDRRVEVKVVLNEKVIIEQ